MRTIARTIAKSSRRSKQPQLPSSTPISTKAGCECVAHILQTFTDLDPEATIMSIDEVGAYDLISRNAMLEGLFQMEGGDQIRPLCEMFLREPIHIFVGGRDGHHPVHFTRRRRGAGRPPHALLFALGQHRALEAIHERMRPGEHVMAFLDDTYTACRPERLDEVHTTVEEQLATHAHIHVHHGKTQVWNRGGVEPSGIEEVTRVARVLKFEAVVWRGDPLLLVAQQGTKVMGIPIGKTEYVQEFLEHKTRQQQVLFQRMPWVNETESAFLLFLHVWRHKGKLLVACSQTRRHRRFCQTS